MIWSKKSCNGKNGVFKAALIVLVKRSKYIIKKCINVSGDKKGKNSLIEMII